MANMKKPGAVASTESTNAFVEAFRLGRLRPPPLPPRHPGLDRARQHAGARRRVLTKKERGAITQGLKTIEAEIERGEFAWSTSLEDVRRISRARLTERIGDAGKETARTGRSRNDQVATDLRALPARPRHRRRARRNKSGCKKSLLQVAEREAETVMPGFYPSANRAAGDLRPPSHGVVRDAGARRRAPAQVSEQSDVLPLGARRARRHQLPHRPRPHTAKLLGFAAVAENSLDAVSDATSPSNSPLARR